MSAFDAEVTVRRIRFANPETGWAVVEAAGSDGTPIALVGPLVHLEERERARIVGTWVQDSRYGPQVKASEAHPLPPSDADADAVVAYLRPDRPRRAQERRPAHRSLRRQPRVRRHRRRSPRGVQRSGPERVVDQQGRSVVGPAAHHPPAHLLLAPHGLAYLAPRIHETYGDGAHRVVAERPYELTSVFGVGFLTADRIARHLGVADDGPERTRAALLHALSEAERGGSTCLPLEC